MTKPKIYISNLQTCLSISNVSVVQPEHENNVIELVEVRSNGQQVKNLEVSFNILGNVLRAAGIEVIEE